MANASDRRQIAEARAKAKREEAIDAAMMKVIMGTLSGRNWMWRQLEFAQIFNGNGNLDPQVMAFEKGARNFGLKLYRDVALYTPNEFVTMLRENTRVKLEETKDEDDVEPN